MQANVMDGPKCMLVAYKSYPSFIENNDQSIEANWKVRGSLWIIMMLGPLYFSWPFVFNFSLGYGNRSKRSVLGIPLANEKDEL